MTDILYTSMFPFDTIVSSNKGKEPDRVKVETMKRTKRSRRVNISIEVCFNSFYKELDINLKRASESKDLIDLRIENIEEAGRDLRYELYGMMLIGGFSWKDYLVLREKVYRITKEYVTTIKNL